MQEVKPMQDAEINYGEIYASALKLLHHSTPEKTYETIINEAKKLVGGKHGTIFLIENDKLKRVYATSELLYKIFPRKRGFTSRVHKNYLPYLLTREELLKVHPEFENLSIGSDIGIPLIYNDAIIGVLAVFSKMNTKFTKKDLSILNTFGPVASLAIRNMQLYSEVKESLDERDLFISMAAHELKTPLTTISIYSQLLLRKDPESKYSEIQIKMKLSSEIRRITNLVNELLQVNQIKMGSLKFSFKKCDLCSVVSTAITAFENINPDYLIHFKNELKNKYCFVNGDFDKLFQVITNLLNNAVKFSPKNLSIDIVLKYESSNYLLTITDHGSGIHKKDLPRIFERFYKGNSQEKDGFGIGLFLVKNIIDRHNGKISVESRSNKGTTFSIALPIYYD